MLESVAYFQIFGKPFIMYTGILALVSFLFTASVAILNRRGIRIVPFVWHPRLAAASIILALMHGILGLLTYF